MVIRMLMVIYHSFGQRQSLMLAFLEERHRLLKTLRKDVFVWDKGFYQGITSGVAGVTVLMVCGFVSCFLGVFLI